MVSLDCKSTYHLLPPTLASMMDSKLKISGKRCVDEEKIPNPTLISDQKRKEEKDRRGNR